MSIFSNIRRALGFQEMDDDEDYNDAPLGYELSNRADKEPVAPERASAPADAEVSSSQAMEEIERLNAALAKMTTERDTMQKQLLSAERQKRALTDRIYDLDQRVTDLETEKEKLMEETCTLRVAAKRGLSPREAAEEIKEADSRQQAELDDLKEENATLKKSIENYKSKAAISDQLIKDLQSKASTANRELQEAQKELDEAEKAIGQVTRFEEYKRNTDMRLAELQRLVAMKDKEIRSLNSTIEHNLVKHGEAQSLLRKEIEQLRAGSSPVRQPSREPEAAEPPAKERSRRQRVDDNQPTLF